MTRAGIAPGFTVGFFFFAARITVR